MNEEVLTITETKALKMKLFELLECKDNLGVQLNAASLLIQLLNSRTQLSVMQNQLGEYLTEAKKMLKEHMEKDEPEST